MLDLIKSHIFNRMEGKLKFSRSSTWGEGIVDEGVSFFWSRPEWHSISDDELIFYSPLLASDGQGAARSSRLIKHLTQAIACRIWWIVQSRIRLGSFDRTPSAEVKDVILREIDRSSIVSAAGTAGTLFEAGFSSSHLWFGNVQMRGLAGRGRRRFGPKSRAADLAAEKAFHAQEYDILRILAKCLEKIQEDPHNIGASVDLTLPELGLAAIHGAVSPIYFTRGWAHLHETMTVACWLGFLLRKRTAYLSPEIARQMEQILQAGPSPIDKTEAHILDEIIVSHAELVFGAEKLKALAHKCAENACVAKISPKSKNLTQLFSEERFFVFPKSGFSQMAST